MSDEKTYTEREMVLARRQAYGAGAWDFYYDEAVPSSSEMADVANRTAALASTRYPLPKVTRPRVVKDEYGFQWRIQAGYVAWRMDENTQWSDKLHAESGFSLTITTRRAQVIADLLAHPTEQVEAE